MRLDERIVSLCGLLPSIGVPNAALVAEVKPEFLRPLTCALTCHLP